MAPDKFELHYRQQLSALIDGELPADEARFVLRRLQHDEELSGCHERWQMCGDILRGRVCAPAPADFSDRVRRALAAETPLGRTADARDAAGRRTWRWGGGAALAASVAAVALFMARERLPERPAPSADPAPLVAASSPGPAAATPPAASPAAPAPAPADPQGDLATVVAAAPAVAIAANRRQDAAVRRGATRTQQAARSGARAQEPVRALASAPRAAPLTPIAPVAVAQQGGDPFAHQAAPLPTRPWPRSTLAPAAGSGGEFTASFPTQRSPTPFYPFEPQLPAEAASDLPPLPQP
ncbi:hypothetical protein JR065_10820 [Xanthomonas sp. AmX2]|uniref:RseA family anti-sigma factor n=1 Tax=Xanthomonas sp. TaxID=29446 RepID=UPI00197F017F|nr:RseA family anti-sigma factor [Xanthomonas sp.]MBN6150835.1 hypothetical protein [Xanthomonas sp.]